EPRATTRHVARDELAIDREARGHALENADERRPVALAGGEKAKAREHVAVLVSARDVVEGTREAREARALAPGHIELDVDAERAAEGERGHRDAVVAVGANRDSSARATRAAHDEIVAVDARVRPEGSHELDQPREPVALFHAQLAEPAKDARVVDVCGDRDERGDFVDERGDPRRGDVEPRELRGRQGSSG